MVSKCPVLGNYLHKMGHMHVLYLKMGQIHISRWDIKVLQSSTLAYFKTILTHLLSQCILNISQLNLLFQSILSQSY